MTDQPNAAPAGTDAVAWAIERWADEGLPNTQSLALLSMVVRTHQLVTARLETVLHDFELNLPRYLVLMSLMVAPGGAYRLSTLRWLLLVHHTTVTILVDGLEKRGLVRRERHPTDRRSTLAVITPAGRELGRRSSAAVGEANFGLPVLEPAKAARLVELLQEIRELTGDLADEHGLVEQRIRRRPDADPA